MKKRRFIEYHASSPSTPSIYHTGSGHLLFPQGSWLCLFVVVVVVVFAGGCLPTLSMTDSVTAVVKVLTSVFMSVSVSKMVREANLPPTLTWKASATPGSFSFSRLNLKVLILSVLTLNWKRLLIMMESIYL